MFLTTQPSLQHLHSQTHTTSKKQVYFVTGNIFAKGEEKQDMQLISEYPKRDGIDLNVPVAAVCGL